MWVDALIIIDIARAKNDTVVIMYICVCMCFGFDVASVYLCGYVSIWTYRLFVLDRMDTGGEGPLVACCSCESLPPVSALIHMVLAF